MRRQRARSQRRSRLGGFRRGGPRTESKPRGDRPAGRDRDPDETRRQRDDPAEHDREGRARDRGDRREGQSAGDRGSGVRRLLRRRGRRLGGPISIGGRVGQPALARAPGRSASASVRARPGKRCPVRSGRRARRGRSRRSPRHRSRASAHAARPARGGPRGPHARLTAMTHPSLGAPPRSRTAGFPDAAARIRARTGPSRRAGPAGRDGCRRHDRRAL